MAILITGGMWFIGSNLCNFLVNINDKNEVDKFIILYIRLVQKIIKKTKYLHWNKKV